MTQVVGASGEASAARKRTRSPAYPYVNLQEAIERAKQFHAREQRNAANTIVAGKHWGFTDGSSSGSQTIAALISYGLMQDEGTGDKRAVRLTNNALRILLDNRPDSQERDDLIRQAALSPKIHRQIWDKWETLPSDASLRHALLFEWETPFNENSVDYFIKEFRDTIAFAKLSKSDKIEGEDGKKDELTKVKAGSYVQWVSQGMEHFLEPRKVERISDDGQFAFLEGENTGFPTSELEICDAPVRPPVRNVNMNTQEQSRPPLQEIQRPMAANAWTWTLSIPRSVKAELRIAGNVTKGDIARLKKQIEFLESSFDDEEAAQ
jgi:hypothetical protein